MVHLGGNCSGGVRRSVRGEETQERYQRPGLLLGITTHRRGQQSQPVALSMRNDRHNAGIKIQHDTIEDYVTLQENSWVVGKARTIGTPPGSRRPCEFNPSVE